METSGEVWRCDVAHRGGSGKIGSPTFMCGGLKQGGIPWE